jgi:2-polyprenyl-6-methoxyphenol hydroxylase-like FAD-dependent oxidoreductase
MTASGKSSPQTGRAIVIGGSLAGLLAGNLLHRNGWSVEVFERTTGVMEGRGAGITVLPGLTDGFRAAGVDETEQSLGVVLPARIALDREGRIVAQRRFPQVMTSWRRLYESLRVVFPPERYHDGSTLERVEQSGSKVTALFHGGERADADLLIAADGLRSIIRAQCLPDAKPWYAGYIAWRCLTDERALSPRTHATLFDRYAVCVAPGEQGIGYAVPGQDHGVEPGRRQYNVVWYHPVPEDDLPRLMTDESGRHHPHGIPPALIRTQIRDEMTQLARSRLAPQFAEAVERARLVFFQPIVDLESPRLAFGRIAIVGDAAFTARPHVAMGVPKAAGDMLSLVAALADNGSDVPSALRRFERERLRMGHAIVERGRYLGSYMEAQLGTADERRRAEAARIPERVMLETAAPMDFDRLAAELG